MPSRAARGRTQGKAAGRARNVIIRLDQLLATGKRKLKRGGAQTSEGTLVTGTSGANAAIAITLAAVPNRRNGIKAAVVSYSGAPTGGRLSITDNAVSVFDVDLTGAGPHTIPLPDGVQNLAVNTALVATLAAGGGALVGKINLSAVLN